MRSHFAQYLLPLGVLALDWALTFDESRQGGGRR
jgi:hypothetical protein